MVIEHWSANSVGIGVAVGEHLTQPRLRNARWAGLSTRVVGTIRVRSSVQLATQIRHDLRESKVDTVRTRQTALYGVRAKVPLDQEAVAAERCDASIPLVCLNRDEEDTLFVLACAKGGDLEATFLLVRYQIT